MFLIAGLILLLAGSSWFAGAVTVGWILVIVGALEVGWYVFCLLMALGIAVFGHKQTRTSRSRFR